MPTRLPSFLVLLLGCALVPTAHGQQPDTTQLPEIAPREIEIRGEREIALPSLERQPLTGFAAPPKIPSVPTDHRPYVKPYEQELGDLPESLPLPDTVAAPLVPAAPPLRGFVEGGSGRYFSRFFEGRTFVPLSAHEHVSIHGMYTGTQGHTPFAGDSVSTPSDVAEVQVRLESSRDPVQVTAEVHGSAERYTLYGVTPPTEDADRNGYSVGSTLYFKSLGTVPATVEVRYDHTQYTSHLPTLNGGDGVEYREAQVLAHGSVTAPVPLRPHLDATYSHSWLGGDPLSDTAFSLDAGGHLSVFQQESVSVEAGVRAFAFETPARPSRRVATPVDATYVVPTLNVEWQLSESTTLHVRNAPRLAQASLLHLYGQNPYAMHAPSLRPTIETTHAETGLTLASGLVRAVATVGFRYAPTYRYFVPGSQGGFTDGIYRVRYGSARILQGRARIALQGVEGVQASLGVSARDGVLGDSETTIPNFAPVTADAMLGVSFANGDGYFQALSEFQSPRYSTTAETTRLDPYFTLDLEASYDLSSTISILARADNLAFQSPTRWAGYPRPPAEVAAGLRIRW